MFSKNTKISLCQFLDLQAASFLNLLFAKHNLDFYASYHQANIVEEILQAIMPATQDQLESLLDEIVKTMGDLRNRVSPRYRFDERWDDVLKHLSSDGYTLTDDRLTFVPNKELPDKDKDIPSQDLDEDPTPHENTETTREYQYDVFICHASEDKESFVRGLANKLKEKNVKVWFDEFTLTLGDSLRRSIDYGLSNSRFGVVILSPDFFKKEWPQKELDGLIEREINGKKVILPIWHNVSREDVMSFSPILASRYAVQSSRELDHVVDEILKVLQPDYEISDMPVSAVLPIEKVEIPLETTDSQTKEAVTACVLQERRGLVLYGYTDDPLNIPSWANSDSDLIKNMQSPPNLLSRGWNLKTDGRLPIIIKGSFRRVLEEDKKKVIDFYRNGHVVFAMSAEEDFLAHGKKDSDLKINSIALISVVYNFLCFYKLVLDNSDNFPKKFNITAKLHNMHLNDELSYMSPYEPSEYEFDKYSAPTNDWSKTIEFDTKNIDINMATYYLVQEVFLWFGMDMNMIPYTKVENGIIVIDSEQIKNI